MFNNTGAVEHDAFIGDAAAQAAHEEEMNPSDGMSSSSSMSSGDMGSDTTMDSDMGSQDDGDGITVKPGETGELTYTFNKPGTVEIGCHVGSIGVAPRRYHHAARTTNRTAPGLSSPAAADA